jgi:hypothetical protein
VKLLPKNKNDPFQPDPQPEFLTTSDEQEKVMTWLSRCSAIAGSASYIMNGYAESQVGVLRLELKAATDGVDWRKVYAPIIERWHTRRPLRLHVDKTSQLEGTFKAGDKIEAQATDKAHASSMKHVQPKM